MLLRADQSRLLIIDLQQRLLPAIDQGPQVLGHAIWLARVAHRLGVPTQITEQYPAGLGPTDPTLLDAAADAQVLHKTHFSATAEAGCRPALLDARRPQLVIAGAEAHVCVLQTALGLLAEGLKVHVVAEAVGSRRASDHALALGRMRDAGAVIVSREMVAFEWLERAGTELFRGISRDLLR